MAFHETIPGLDHWLTTPPEPDPAICPICGEECDTIYANREGVVVGCDNCIESYDAFDCPACFPEKE